MEQQVFECVRGMRFHSLDEVVNVLKDAGFDVEDVTTQYVTVWVDGRLITLMLGGSLNNFHVCYTF